jgi:hypothetical protein
MDKQKHIRCAECRYTAVDKNASEYARRTCTDCEHNADCACVKKTGKCKCGKGCKHRKDPDIPCPKQQINWAAVQCVNSDSEYFRALLNVSINGDMQSRITWSGCEDGEAR